MYNVIYMGAYNEKICSIVSRFSNIKVISFIVDSSISDDAKNELCMFWQKKNVPEVELIEEEIKKADLIFVCGYTKIIKNSLLKDHVFVNIHAGNLPKWRGSSANSWSIINGEYNIAYTLHRVTDELDGGPIFYKYEYFLKQGEKYGDARKKLELMLEESLEDVFIEICSGRNVGESQEGDYIYCNS